MACRFLLVLAGVALAPAARADEPVPAAQEPVAIARRVWAVMDLVQQNHIEPPARHRSRTTSAVPPRPSRPRSSSRTW
jgi:hypothetical protein